MNGFPISINALFISFRNSIAILTASTCAGCRLIAGEYRLERRIEKIKIMQATI
ncbi:hypothetical protein AC77_2538 [Escherichia coli 5-366-08_S4_C1]|nr:hypothetical protein AC77_2538 [Escherichia coli 5-366-08_S4_C1]